MERTERTERRAIVKFNTKLNKHELIENNIILKSYVSLKDLQNYVQLNNIEIVTEDVQNTITVPEFSVNDKFKFVEQLSDLVIKGIAPSMVISGQPGIGKSFGLFQSLDNHGLFEGEDYVVIKGGNISPRGLFDLLKENAEGKIVIIDDADSILSTQNSLMLKGVLDSSKKRIITWVTMDGVEEVVFNSSVIILTNLPKHKIDSAVLSRSYYVNLQLTNEELIERMRFLLPNIEADLSLPEKIECLDLLDEYKTIANEVNVRTLLKLFNIRKLNDNWRQLATYSLIA